MGILDGDMRRVVDEQRLAFVATVNADGTPNLSARGTIAVWDDDHLVFTDIRSPNTTRNLRANPAIEINVVDPIVRKGYRFKGTATVREPDEAALSFYEGWGLESAAERIRAVIVVRVEKALPLTSPAYDRGRTEADLRAENLARVNRLHGRS